MPKVHIFWDVHQMHLVLFKVFTGTNQLFRLQKFLDSRPAPIFPGNSGEESSFQPGGNMKLVKTLG